MNVKNPSGKVFKQPLTLGKQTIRSKIIDNSFEYLLKLETIDGKPVNITF